MDNGDAEIGKYSAEGEPLWKRQFEAPTDAYSNHVATDEDGNVYISGNIENFPSEGLGDAWLAKYSAAGEFRWKRLIGTPDDDVSTGLATDRDGNVYISGWTNGSLGGRNKGGNDAWLAKYSASGALRWKRQLGTSAYDVSLGIATVGDGNVYISGETNGPLGGTNAGSGGAFVAKYFTRR